MLALVCGVNLAFCYFPMWYPGSGVVLIESIPDLCPISYFVRCKIGMRSVAKIGNTNSNTLQYLH